MKSFWLLCLAKLVCGFYLLTDESEKTDTQTATVSIGRDDLNKCLCNKRFKMCDNNCPCDADCSQEVRRLWRQKYLGSSEFIERVKAFACPQSFLSNVTFATEGLSRTPISPSTAVPKHLLHRHQQRRQVFRILQWQERQFGCCWRLQLDFCSCSKGEQLRLVDGLSEETRRLHHSE